MKEIWVKADPWKKELVTTASGTMSDLRISKEKKIMKRFLKEVTKTEGSLAIYGEKHIRKALEMGVVETLLLSENLRRYRVKLKEKEAETGPKRNSPKRG